MSGEVLSRQGNSGANALGQGAVCVPRRARRPDGLEREKLDEVRGMARAGGLEGLGVGSDLCSEWDEELEDSFEQKRAII